MKRLVVVFLFLFACGTSTSNPDAAPSDSGTVDTGHPSSPCGKTSVDNVNLLKLTASNPLDPLGYPPYTADACQLAYVAKDGSLVLRDLISGTESMVADANEKPRRPSIASGLLAWEATIAGKDVVRWRSSVGVIATIPSAAFRAGEPRAAADAIAFTGFTSADPLGDSDVFLFTTSDQTIVSLGDGPAQQRFSDIDATRVAWSDFSEAGPNGAFDANLYTEAGYTPSDIVVYDRTTKTKTTRNAPNKQAFPLLVANGNVAYLDWDQVRPQPKFFAYGFKVGGVTADPSLDVNIGLTDTIETNAPYVRPTVHGTSFDWLQNGLLYRRPIDLSTPAKSVAGQMGDAYGVVDTDGLSILAVGTSTGDLTLLGLER